MSTLPIQLDGSDQIPDHHLRSVRSGIETIDRRQADRTIPRGVDAHDADRTPAVDTTVWLDHVSYARVQDPRVLDRLVAEYDRYARSLARRMQRDGEPVEDLDQIALEALVVALRRFDPERGIPFPAFATPTILGALRRHYRDHGWLVRVPRQVHEFAMAERATTERLVTTLGRQPTAPELAAELGMDLDALLEAQDALHARDARSLDAHGTDERPPGELLGAEDGRFAAAENRVAVAEAMAALEGPARQLLYLYYYEERTQSEIAEILGVSQMQVSRLLSAILRRLRRRVGPR